LPSSEQAYSTWYSFSPPQVERDLTVVRLFIVHEDQRLPLAQEELAGPLRQMGVPIEQEAGTEAAAWPCEAFAEAVEAFHTHLPADLVGSVVLSARGFALVETPSRQGAGEHRRRRALIERFLRAEGVSFTTECRVVLSEAACQPLPAELTATAGGALG
jgi:hypothetical protein